MTHFILKSVSVTVGTVAFMVVAAAAATAELLLPHRGPETQIFVQKHKIRLFGHILSMKSMKKNLVYMKKNTLYCLLLIFSNSFDFLGTFLGFCPLCAVLFLDLARELCNFLTPLWRAGPS